MAPHHTQAQAVLVIYEYKTEDLLHSYEAGFLECSLELWAVEADDDLAGDVGGWDTLELAAEFAKKFVFGTLILFDVSSGKRDAKALEPLLLGAAKCTPWSAVDSNC